MTRMVTKERRSYNRLHDELMISLNVRRQKRDFPFPRMIRLIFLSRNPNFLAERLLEITGLSRVPDASWNGHSETILFIDARNSRTPLTTMVTWRTQLRKLEQLSYYTHRGSDCFDVESSRQIPHTEKLPCD